MARKPTRGRPRDFTAEYARRKVAGAERGISLRQARGHPRTGEASVASLRRSGAIGAGRGRDRTLERYYRVVGRLAKGESLRRATRAEQISSRTINRLNDERVLFGYFYRTGKRGQSVFDGYWVRYHARMPILSRDGVLHTKVPLDQKNASLIGQYWHAEREARHGKVEALTPFKNLVIYDANGHAYRLQTEVNALYRFYDAMTDEEQADFNRTFYSGREVLYVTVA